jgi:hypothetical protein
MKKIILVFILISTLLSCSSDSDEIETTSNDNSFFNINTGNKWVYKRYFFSNSTNEYSASNHIDSVFVTGDTVINALNYKKLMHKEYVDIVQSPNIFTISFGYLRIDENDHLVSTNGFVLHPGFDDQYQYVHNYNIAGDPSNGTLGQATFQIEAPQNILVEGTNYLSYDYKGNFIGNPSLNIPNNTIHYMYSEQIGLIKQVCPYASGYGLYEDRLIYYIIN